MAGREAYNGSRRKLAIAFDLGTTFSGISYRYVPIEPMQWKIKNAP